MSPRLQRGPSLSEFHLRRGFTATTIPGHDHHDLYHWIKRCKDHRKKMPIDQLRFARISCEPQQSTGMYVQNELMLPFILILVPISSTIHTPRLIEPPPLSNHFPKFRPSNKQFPTITASRPPKIPPPLILAPLDHHRLPLQHPTGIHRVITFDTLVYSCTLDWPRDTREVFRFGIRSRAAPAAIVGSKFEDVIIIRRNRPLRNHSARLARCIPSFRIWRETVRAALIGLAVGALAASAVVYREVDEAEGYEREAVRLLHPPE